MFASVNSFKVLAFQKESRSAASKRHDSRRRRNLEDNVKNKSNKTKFFQLICHRSHTKYTAKVETGGMFRQSKAKISLEIWHKEREKWWREKQDDGHDKDSQKAIQEREVSIFKKRTSKKSVSKTREKKGTKSNQPLVRMDKYKMWTSARAKELFFDLVCEEDEWVARGKCEGVRGRISKVQNGLVQSVAQHKWQAAAEEQSRNQKQFRLPFFFFLLMAFIRSSRCARAISASRRFFRSSST